MRLGAWLLALAMPALLGAARPAPLSFDIVTNGEVNGALEVVTDAAGGMEMRNRYQSQDKQRELVVRVTLDDRGLPLTMDRAGQSFAYQSIAETFGRAAGTARWRNRIEDASRRDTGSYYIPLGLSQAGDSAAYELGLLASALLRAPDRTLPLLPVGRARARVVANTVVRDGTRQEALRLVAIDGLGMEPDHVWLDSAGQLFAARTTVRRGWRAAIPELERLRADADLADVTAALPRPDLAGRLLIDNVRVFDAPRAQMLPGRHDVLIREGRIAAIAPRGRLGPAARGVRRIAGEGQTLLPGLWDMHVHLGGPREALRHLASGVTTVRDMGNDNRALARLVDQLDGGALPGPRVIRAGFIEGRSPSATYTGRLVDDRAGALAAVDAYAAKGAAQIKLYNAVDPAWIEAIARASRARGMRLSGHVPFGGTAETAVRAGYDEIQHWVFLFLNFAPQPVTSGLTFAAARVAHRLDLQGPEMTRLVTLLRERRTVMDLTLAVYEPLLRGRAGEPAPAFTCTVALPPAMLRQVALGPLPTPPDMTATAFAGTYGKALALARLLHERGVPIVAGTDFAPLAGLTLPRELELLVEAGLPPAAVLRIATADAARIMRRDDRSGSIAVGKDADLLLMRGDPTRDIAAIRQVSLVVRGGVPHRPRRLLAAAGLQ